MRLGDVVQIKTAAGFAYGQYINRHRRPPTLGDLVRILPGVFAAPQTDVAELAKHRGGYCCFWPVKAAVRRGEVSLVGHAPIPKEYRAMPRFKWARRHLISGKVIAWGIWNGKKASIDMVDKLTKEEKKYPLREIVDTVVVVRRIEHGWTPEEECKRQPMDIWQRWEPTVKDKVESRPR